MPQDPAAEGREPYDLTIDAADFPAWEGPPARSIVICTHPRSGSTLLGEAIYHSGGLGLPLEYFHRGFRPDLQRRWGAESLDAYVRQAHRRRTDPAGVFSAKLFWQDLEQLAHERDPAAQPDFGQRPLGSLEPDDYRRLADLVADLFPNPVHVRLVRKDRVRQAVSALAATQTGLWRAIPGVGAQAARAAPEYDYRRLADLMGVEAYCQGHWTRYFEALGVRPYSLCYEDLDADYAATVQALLEHLGGRDPAPGPRMRRQSGAETEALVLRYLRDEARGRGGVS